MLKEHSPNLNKYLEQPTKLHSTCRHTQLMNRLHLQLQSKLLLSLSLVRHFRFRCGAKQNQLQCTFCPTLVSASPAYIFATASTIFRFARPAPCRARILTRIPGCLVAWLPDGGLLRNAKQHTMQPRGKHNTQSDFYIRTASASPAQLGMAGAGAGAGVVVVALLPL